jgi:DNA-binding transcriptional ArsR family regulator
VSDDADHEPRHGFDVLQDPAALRTLAHPTRQRIYGAAVREAVSAKELAERFEQPLARISYHVKTLADAGLLQVVRRTPRRGATETHYRAVSTLEVSDEVVERAGPEFRALWAESGLRNLADDAVHAFTHGAAEAPDAFIARAHFVTTEAGRRRLREEVRAFYTRLGRLEEELWREVAQTDAPRQELSVGVLFYPGSLRGERNRSLIITRTLPGDEDLDTIPPVAAERD